MAGQRMRLTTLLREPMVLFFAVGGLLFALAPRGERSDDVRVSARGLRSLVEAEARRRHVTELPPAAVAAVRARALDDELLYREGLRLGVDKNDNVVRQRVIEKMLFLAEDLAGDARPISDDELSAYLAAHAERFRRATVVSFVHVFSSAGPEPLARLTLAPGTDDTAAPNAGDAFALGRRVVDATLDAVGKSYGAAFAAEVSTLRPGVWSAPVRSAYGFHLVKVLARHDGGVPSLAELRGEVRIAYLQERKTRATAQFLRDLHARYHITVDEHDAADALVERSAAAASREAD